MDYGVCSRLDNMVDRSILTHIPNHACSSQPQQIDLHRTYISIPSLPYPHLYKHELTITGTPQHLDTAHSVLLSTHSTIPYPHPELHTLVARGNAGTKTYDGMDVCAGRVMLEVKREIRRLERGDGEQGGRRRVGWISIMGYSLGGCEYCILN